LPLLYGVPLLAAGRMLRGAPGITGRGRFGSNDGDAGALGADGPAGALAAGRIGSGATGGYVVWGAAAAGRRSSGSRLGAGAGAASSDGNGRNGGVMLGPLGADGALGAAATGAGAAGGGRTGSGAAGGGTMSAARRRRTPPLVAALAALADAAGGAEAELPLEAAVSTVEVALADVVVAVALLDWLDAAAVAVDVPEAGAFRRRVGAAGFSARARFSRSQRARTRATCSSESGLVWLRTGTSIERSKFITSSAEMPNSPAISLTRLLTPPS
jgi:hypothetical protein